VVEVVEQVKEKVPLLQQLAERVELVVVELVVAQDYQEQHQVQFQEQLILEVVEVDLQTQQGKILLTEEQEQAVKVSWLRELMLLMEFTLQHVVRVHPFLL
jgi:hypothetical protein